MKVTVIHPSGEPDQFNSNMGGPMLGHKLVCQDANGNTVYVEVNTKGQDQKSANAYPPGRTFEFLPNGRTFDGQAFWYDEANGWTPYCDAQGVPLHVQWQKGKREDQAQGGGRNMSPQGNPYNGGAPHQAPQGTPQRPGAPHGAANAPQAHSRTVPTMSQAVAVLKECIVAVDGIGGSDGHATTLFLARLRGDVKRDATPAEKEAAVAAKAAAEAAAKAAEEKRLADEAARAQQQAALGAMPPMSPEVQGFGSDDVPFSFALLAGLGTLLAALSGSGLPGVA
ncbi:MAG: hypothetical protein WC273_10690 [Dehalococcoidia bacterium]